MYASIFKIYPLWIGKTNIHTIIWYGMKEAKSNTIFDVKIKTECRIIY